MLSIQPLQWNAGAWPGYFYSARPCLTGKVCNFIVTYVVFGWHHSCAADEADSYKAVSAAGTWVQTFHTGTAADGKTLRLDKEVRCESRFPRLCTARLALTRDASFCYCAYVLRILGCVYFCAVYDPAGKVDPSKGCRNPKRNLRVTTRSSEKR